jgi:tRNA modification GTPase
VPVLQVFNKVDAAPRPHGLPRRRIGLSARTGAGLDALRQRAAGRPAGRPRPRACSSRARATCRRCSARASTCAGAGPCAANGDAALDLLAEELRLAHDALGEITGAFTADDLLGEIFSRFCIGK